MTINGTTSNGKDRSQLIPFSSRLREGRALAQDVWSIFNAANLPADCINLGQGYMNFGPPEWIKSAAEEALNTVATNHYSHPKGRPRLREAIKAHYEPEFGRTLNADTEILVTSGANEGQYSVFVAFLEHRDEVIMFEPFFDQYLPSVTFNGGVPVYVPLHPPTAAGKQSSHEWSIDFDELRRAVTPRTKMIILNTPHNPVGKVFTRHELEQIAAIAEEHNLLVMSDEVYDSLVFDNEEHVRIATLPGMWDRTVTVGSAGKMFAATGWRVGWLIGPPSIIQPTLAATTRIVFCSNSPLQEASAAGLEQANKRGFLKKQLDEYAERRRILTAGFDQLGVKYTNPQGTYFVLLDISNLQWPDDYPFPESVLGRGRDFKACWFIAMEIGVSSIPVSEFYCEEHASIGEAYARFAFCKDFDTLKHAVERLQKLKQYLV
ncbi:PLP-dependent transferase [Dichomitus squalens]|uniref:PLP-dependent transferase n=2 Tax=Dichomitus squalens TaxID=114155 RepID=A0A4Q9NDU5_9APHY|nr:PLP-dependent transferase [Dichomitus squalens LYAD-421 SS1]EJF56584.1 PLP-dependent transferase [Dichomitus squalens LYAD-421 SS1]TBU38718.1 PLP-dependent transferase [Dichomitus squalens]TBU58371.1 PLP-dependent transferase [Dichomitus squalens]